MKDQKMWLIGAGVIGVLYIYLKGKKSASPNTTATSVANATNTPTWPVTSKGSQVTQLIPTNQVTPNEPGTSAIINTNGGFQYT